MIFKLLGATFLSLLVFLIISFINYKRDTKKRMKNKNSIKHINIDSKTIEGEVVDNEIFKENKLTMINIWATFCHPCAKELAYLQEIYEEINSKKVGMLGIIVDIDQDLEYNKKADKVNKAKQLIKENNVRYKNVLLDNKLKAYLQDKIVLVPTTVFVDNKGQVIGDTIEKVCIKEEYIHEINNILEKI